jgi:CelD/BcsL family acetyltransferase involved in cellulose biosynthesis
VRVEIVTDDAGLRDLAPEWWALWQRVGGAPFQSPAWMLAWWACFGNARPVVAATPDGLLALYLLDGVLLPMGAGITDYQDVLGKGAAPLLAAALEAAECAESHLTDLPPDSALRRASIPSGWREHPDETDPCPVLTGPVPPGRLRDVRQACHRAGRAGGWQIEIADAERLETTLAAFEALHALRWPEEDARLAAFRRLAAPGLLQAGALSLALLRIGGKPAAGCYALRSPGRLLLYVSGFDPAFVYESPGTILLGWLAEQALAEGREVHFLRGAEDYKRAWGGVARMNTTRRLVRA